MINIQKNNMFVSFCFVNCIVQISSKVLAEDRWVNGFTFQKELAKDEHGNARRTSFMQQLKDFQGEDKDFVDDPTLQKLAREKKVGDIEQKSDDKKVTKSKELTFKEMYEQFGFQGLQRLFMRIIAFLAKK